MAWSNPRPTSAAVPPPGDWSEAQGSLSRQYVLRAGADAAVRRERNSMRCEFAAERRWRSVYLCERHLDLTGPSSAAPGRCRLGAVNVRRARRRTRRAAVL